MIPNSSSADRATTEPREPRRVQLRRTKGWRKPPDAVTVARPTKWGNPFVVVPVGAPRPDLPWWRVCAADHYCPDVPDARRLHMAREEAVNYYRIALDGGMTVDGEPVLMDLPTLDDVRRELAGRDLACWCPLDAPCHADVLLEVANPVPTPAAGDRQPTPQDGQ